MRIYSVAPMHKKKEKTYIYIYTSVAPMHKCIGFVVSSVAVSSLAASKLLFEPSSNRIFEPHSNRFSERAFECESSG